MPARKLEVCLCFDKKNPKTRLYKFLKIRSLRFLNNCFKNEHKVYAKQGRCTLFGGFLQTLYNKT